MKCPVGAVQRKHRWKREVFLNDRVFQIFPPTIMFSIAGSTHTNTETHRRGIRVPKLLQTQYPEYRGEGRKA